MIRTCIALFFSLGLVTVAACGPGEPNPPESVKWEIVGQDNNTELKVSHKNLISDCPNKLAQVEMRNLDADALDWKADWVGEEDSYGEQWMISKTQGILSMEGPEMLVLTYRCQPEESEAKDLWINFTRAGADAGSIRISVDVEVVE